MLSNGSGRRCGYNRPPDPFFSGRRPQFWGSIWFWKFEIYPSMLHPVFAVGGYPPENSQCFIIFTIFFIVHKKSFLRSPDKCILHYFCLRCWSMTCAFFSLQGDRFSNVHVHIFHASMHFFWSPKINLLHYFSSSIKKFPAKSEQVHFTLLWPSVLVNDVHVFFLSTKHQRHTGKPPYPHSMITGQNFGSTYPNFLCIRAHIF